MPLELTKAELRPGFRHCEECNGTGYRSKYDEGYRSLVHSPDLAAPRECMFCGGTGLYEVQVKKLSGPFPSWFNVRASDFLGLPVTAESIGGGGGSRHKCGIVVDATLQEDDYVEIVVELDDVWWPRTETLGLDPNFKENK